VDGQCPGVLAHLRARGVDWAPGPRGRAADGRDALEFLAGEVPRYRGRHVDIYAADAAYLRAAL
jgi:hypothetical protein